MALWGRKGGGVAPRQVQRSGPSALDSFGDARLSAIIGDLVAGNDRLPDVGSLPPADRDYLLGFVWNDKSPIPTDALRKWHEAAPSGIHASALGGALVRDAWRVRGRAYGKDVSVADARGFYVLLREADEFMVAASQQWPGEPSLGISLLVSARGLEYPRDVLEERAAAIYRVEPWNFAAAHQHLQFVCAKWFGSDEEAFRVARQFLQAPPGSAVRSMIATAHIERAVAVEKRVGPASLSRADYDELATELRLVIQAVGPRPAPDQVDALARLVLVLDPSDLSTAAATLTAIEIIDGRCFWYPWLMSGDPLVLVDSTMKEREAKARKLGAR